jgi:hypothetical protein
VVRDGLLTQKVPIKAVDWTVGTIEVVLEDAGFLLSTMSYCFALLEI